MTFILGPCRIRILKEGSKESVGIQESKKRLLKELKE
jgi:hypothetical protein